MRTGSPGAVVAGPGLPGIGGCRRPPEPATPEALDAFLAQGRTGRNALEVVLGIGTFAMSTLADRLTGAPADEQPAAFA